MPKIHSIVHRQTWYCSEMQWLLYPLLLFLPTCYLPSPLLLMNPRMDFCTFIFSSAYMSLGNDPSCILKNQGRYLILQSFVSWSCISFYPDCLLFRLDSKQLESPDATDCLHICVCNGIIICSFSICLSS